MKKLNFMAVLGVVMILVVLFVLGKIIIDAHNADVYLSTLPIKIQTPGGFHANPDYYCERIDAEKRIGYNCTPSGGSSIVVYPEYHMSVNDAWMYR